MKILGLNNFNSKKGDSWLVVYGCQKPQYSEGKKGFEVCEHWFRNPSAEVRDKLELGACVDVLYRKEGDRAVPFDVVLSEEEIVIDF